MDFETVHIFKEKISRHDVSLSRLDEWKCPNCGICGDGIQEWANHVSKKLVEDFGIIKMNRWVPFLVDGHRGDPVPSFREAELLMAVSPVDVVRIDREYRFVSRWFNPSREA